MPMSSEELHRLVDSQTITGIESVTGYSFLHSTLPVAASNDERNARYAQCIKSPVVIEGCRLRTFAMASCRLNRLVELPRPPFCTPYLNGPMPCRCALRFPTRKASTSRLLCFAPRIACMRSPLDFQERVCL